LAGQGYHLHLWGLKGVLWTLLTIISFFIPYGFFMAYVQLARVVSVLFLVVQVIILIGMWCVCVGGGGAMWRLPWVSAVVVVVRLCMCVCSVVCVKGGGFGLTCLPLGLPYHLCAHVPPAMFCLCSHTSPPPPSSLCPHPLTLCRLCVQGA
jgi:hypothetical protein